MRLYIGNYSCEELEKEANILFKSVQEFIEYYDLKIVTNNGFIIDLSTLHELYCESAENYIDFNQFCDNMVGNSNPTKLAIRITSNDQFFFKERSLQNVYNKKVKNKPKTLPKFKQRFKLKNKV